MLARIQRGRRGPGSPLRNQKTIGFLGNSGPTPMENHKATTPVFNVGPLSARHETLFQWLFAGGR